MFVELGNKKILFREKKIKIRYKEYLLQRSLTFSKHWIILKSILSTWITNLQLILSPINRLAAMFAKPGALLFRGSGAAVLVFAHVANGHQIVVRVIVWGWCYRPRPRLLQPRVKQVIPQAFPSGQQWEHGLPSRLVLQRLESGIFVSEQLRFAKRLRKNKRKN